MKNEKKRKVEKEWRESVSQITYVSNGTWKGDVWYILKTYAGHLPSFFNEIKRKKRIFSLYTTYGMWGTEYGSRRKSM